VLPSEVVEDEPDPADGGAARFVVSAERRRGVAGAALERAVDLHAAGLLDEPPDVLRPRDCLMNRFTWPVSLILYEETRTY
jgi:hypothetical protein